MVDVGFKVWVGCLIHAGQILIRFHCLDYGFCWHIIFLLFVIIVNYYKTRASQQVKGADIIDIEEETNKMHSS